ncbi:MAG: hypothetical protein ACI3ZP_06375 [Candidatus Cryptobacteroides sp.]
MRNKVVACICEANDSKIKFEENNRKIVFLNPERKTYLKVAVDGCTIRDGLRCDNLLLSSDEHEERYVELKGVQVMHAIDQLEVTINRLGEYDENRHAFVISTNVAPAITSQIQRKIKLFKQTYNSSLTIRERQLTVPLYQ